MRKLLILVVAVVSVAACGGDDSDQATPTTEREPSSTTSTTVDPETAFMAEVDENTDGSGGDAEIIDFGQSICFALDGTDLAVDDAPNDTPETDAQITEQIVTAGLDEVMAADLDDDLTAVIMRAAGAELCPEHYGTIVTYLNTR